MLLAQAARLRGAEVTLLHGPLQVPVAWLEGLRCEPFTSAAELEGLLQCHQPEADAVLMAAAVADQRLREPLHHKLAKDELQQILAAKEREMQAKEEEKAKAKAKVKAKAKDRRQTTGRARTT